MTDVVPNPVDGACVHGPSHFEQLWKQLFAKIKLLSGRNVFEDLWLKDVKASIDDGTERFLRSRFFLETSNVALSKVTVNHSLRTGCKANNTKLGWIVNLPQRHGHLGSRCTVFFKQVTNIKRGDGISRTNHARFVDLLSEKPHTPGGSHRSRLLIDPRLQFSFIQECSVPVMDVVSELLPTIAGGHHDLGDARPDHGVLDIVNHGTPEYLNHGFWASLCQRHQPGTLATGHDDAQHGAASTSSNRSHSSHVLLLGRL